MRVFILVTLAILMAVVTVVFAVSKLNPDRQDKVSPHFQSINSVIARDGAVLFENDVLKIRLSGSSIPITDESFKDLKYAEGLRVLDASFTQVTSEGIRFLSVHDELTDLYLNNCKLINDEAIENLIELKNLRNLVLSGTSMTESGKATVAKALPECQVTF